MLINIDLIPELHQRVWYYAWSNCRDNQVQLKGDRNKLETVQVPNTHSARYSLDSQVAIQGILGGAHNHCKICFNRWMIQKQLKLKYLSILPSLSLTLQTFRSNYLAFTGNEPHRMLAGKEACRRDPSTGLVATEHQIMRATRQLR